MVTFISLWASKTINFSFSFKMEFRIGQLNDEMVYRAKNLVEAVFFIKIQLASLSALALKIILVLVRQAT